MRQKRAPGFYLCYMWSYLRLRPRMHTSTINSIVSIEAFCERIPPSGSHQEQSREYLYSEREIPFYQTFSFNISFITGNGNLTYHMTCRLRWGGICTASSTPPIVNVFEFYVHFNLNFAEVSLLNSIENHKVVKWFFSGFIQLNLKATTSVKKNFSWFQL